MINFQLSNLKRGFTLIELVVVLGIFMLIMGASVSIFISIIQHQKRILGQQEMVSQASFTQEYMARSLREAAADATSACLFDGGAVYRRDAYLLTRFDAVSGFFQGVKFVSGEGVCHEIFLDKDGIVKETKGAGPAEPLFSSKFTISYARFVVNGSRITMAINMKDPSYENSREMILQTTISKR